LLFITDMNELGIEYGDLKFFKGRALRGPSSHEPGSRPPASKPVKVQVNGFSLKKKLKPS